MTTPKLAMNPARATPTSASGATPKPTKKKKTGKTANKKRKPKKGPTTSNQILRARDLYEKLVQERHARSHDAAWLSTSPTPFTAAAAGTDDAANIDVDSPSFLEQDIEIVHKALQNNGLEMEDITAEGFDSLLQEARKYAMELIADAGDYAMHSHGSDNITSADLILAKEMQSDDLDAAMGLTTSDHIGSLEYMQTIGKIAHETNNRVLPPIPDHCYNGVVLPEVEFTLLGRPFDVVCRAPIDTTNNQTKHSGSGTSSSMQESSNRSNNTIPSYGARRAGHKQIPMNLSNNV